MAKSDSSIIAQQLNLILEKLTLHDQEFKTLHQEISVLRQDMTNQITTIHLKIDTIVRVINDHYLKQGIEIEKLQDIHPKNSHQPVVV